MKIYKKCKLAIAGILCFATGASTLSAFPAFSTICNAEEVQEGTYSEIQESMYDKGTALAMTKDTVYSKTLSAGSLHTFTFTPSYSGLFTVETFGTTDTYGTVSGNQGTIFPSAQDDDSGEGTNFAIGFFQQAGKTTTITVRHYNSTSGTGSYNIQVRDQRAQIYTFNYGSSDIDTTPDSSTPQSWLSSMGYAVGIHQNKPASHLDATIASTFKRINSEVVFFSGHGGSGGGSIVFMNSSGGYDWMLDTSSYFTSMSNTKVAVWSACNSSLDPDGTGSRVSIAQKSINLGAQSAIGWNTTTGVAAAKKWTDQFFLELGNTMTVSAAAASAGSVFLWPWEGSYSGWQVLGDGNTLVSYPNVNPKSAGLSSVPEGMVCTNKEDFDSFISSFDYFTVDLKGLGKRYYKTINGCLTNDFIDVLNDGSYRKTVNSISKDEVIKASSMSLSEPKVNIRDNIMSSDILFNKRVSTKEYTVYMKRNNLVEPIKLIYSDYESSDGIVYQDVICINLNTNKYIDYEDICTVN